MKAFRPRIVSALTTTFVLLANCWILLLASAARCQAPPTAADESREKQANSASAAIGVNDAASNAKSDEGLQVVDLAQGALQLPLPVAWKKGTPRSRIVEHEFTLPKAEGDQEDGRLTIMSAGGGVEANIARWEAQFQTSNGKPLAALPTPNAPTPNDSGANSGTEGEERKTGEGAAAQDVGAMEEGKRVAKRRVGALDVHTVDLRGTFVDRPRGPVGPSVERANYRMLGLIVPTEQHGVWFIKLTGPQKTLAAAEKGFDAMIDGLRYDAAR